VDFRELVKDLASVFRCRIELRQMGIRDEAKVLGGLGTCGRPFCCHAFLPDFVQVSIKMAKEQNLSLNSAKISGACGRLMCCLRYEYDTYLEEGRLTPKVDSLVNTPDGIGVVVEAKPLLGLVKVRPLEDSAVQPKVYAREDLTPIKKGDENYERALEEKQLDKTARAAGTTRAALKAGKDKPEKEEKPQRPQRPAPQRAASYTGQVMPSILSEKAVSLEESAQGLEEQGTLEEKKSTHRGRRGGKHRGGRREGEKGQRPEKGERSERGEQSGQQSEKSGGKNRPPRFEKQSREGENKGEQSRAPRYEKTSREENQPKKGGEQQGVRQQNGNAPKKEGEQKKKNHRPFRHFGKKKDGE
jgi:hypothetical protein